MMDETIWGRNPVMEALRAGRPCNKIMIARGSRGGMGDLVSSAQKKGIPVQYVPRNLLDRLTEGANHQGVAASLSPKKYVHVDDILARAAARGEDPLVIVLAGWEDPQNVGAIIRSAEAAGVHGLIIPRHRAVPLTGTVEKVSAGALEYMLVSRVGNLSQTLNGLKKEGLWVAGADMTGELPYYEAELTGPLALVIGGEGKGLGQLTKICDYLVRIPMQGKIESLNAAAAGSILVFEVMRQRLQAAKKGRRGR
jgi:23S rRNA (guanosine2251-2'-O)-methyltransferase